MSTEGLKQRQIPITDGLFTWHEGEPHLIGGRCKSCGSYFFPRGYVVHKPGCQHREVEEVLLSRMGKLRSYTWHYYQPPSPFRSSEPFSSYGIGLVELPEGIRVFGIMTGCERKDLRTGMDVELVAEKLYTDEQGNERLTWKFRPV